MNSTNWKDIAELVGITAIVASLVFVGLELRQSHQIAIAAEYQERVATVIDIYNTQIQSEIALSVVGQPLYEIVRSADFPDKYSHLYESYTVEQLGYLSTNSLISLTNFDNLYYQYESGFISEESWQAFRYRLRRRRLERRARQTRRQHQPQRASGRPHPLSPPRACQTVRFAGRNQRPRRRRLSHRASGRLSWRS